MMINASWDPYEINKQSYSLLQSFINLYLTTWAAWACELGSTDTDTTPDTDSDTDTRRDIYEKNEDTDTVRTWKKYKYKYISFYY